MAEERAVHPAAAVFPMLADDELAEIAADIKANGLLHPITLDKDGAIVDGRNRHAACLLAGVEPTFTTLADGVDVVAFILSQNVHRRHLTKGQRAMAVMVVNSGYSQRAMAAIMDTSQGLIMQASVVLKHAPDLVENVISGAMTLEAAYAEARRSKDAASSMAAQLGALRAEAPDLAVLVVEEQLTLREALDVLARRRADERRRREAATSGLLSALRFLAPPAGDIVEHADNLLELLDPSLVSGGDVIGSPVVERAIAFLEVVLVGLDERGPPWQYGSGIRSIVTSTSRSSRRFTQERTPTARSTWPR